jgi:hypothetical protein
VFLPEFRLMRSVSFSARRVRDEERAREKRMASMIFDFPEPFGPEITVKCSRKGMVVLRPNDLKLSISISVICKAGPTVCRSG